MRRDHQAVDLSRDDSLTDNSDDRRLGATARLEEKCKVWRLQHGKRFVRNRQPGFRIEIGCRPFEVTARRTLAIDRPQIGQALQQPMQQQSPLEAVPAIVPDRMDQPASPSPAAGSIRRAPV